MKLKYNHKGVKFNKNWLRLRQLKVSKPVLVYILNKKIQFYISAFIQLQQQETQASLLALCIVTCLKHKHFCVLFYTSYQISEREMWNFTSL